MTDRDPAPSTDATAAKPKTRRAPPAETARAKFLSQGRRHLPALYRFVRHELAYRRDAGDLLRGELTVEDVVDAAMLRAYNEFAADPKRRRSAAWWIRLATEFLDAETARFTAERETTRHLEEDVPETPPQEQVSTLGDEILDFYQPDEDWKLEDLIPDVESDDPEAAAESDEVRDRARAALAEMPAEWRRALLLHLTEDLGPAELAHALGRQESEIATVLEQAREHVRRRLEEAGYRLEALPA